jgi:COP9 signalosome complex subunit 4
MDSRLAQLASLSQRDKSPAYVVVLNDLFTNQSSPSFLGDLHTIVDTVVNQDAGGLVVGRQVVSELVKAVTQGIVQDPEVKKQILQDTLNLIQPKIVSYEEHVEWLFYHYFSLLCSIYSIVWISVG